MFASGNSLLGNLNPLSVVGGEVRQVEASAGELPYGFGVARFLLVTCLRLCKGFPRTRRWISSSGEADRRNESQTERHVERKARAGTKKGIDHGFHGFHR